MQRHRHTHKPHAYTLAVAAPHSTHILPIVQHPLHFHKSRSNIFCFDITKGWRSRHHEHHISFSLRPLEERVLLQKTCVCMCVCVYICVSVCLCVCTSVTWRGPQRLRPSFLHYLWQQNCPQWAPPAWWRQGKKIQREKDTQYMQIESQWVRDIQTESEWVGVIV